MEKGRKSKLEESTRQLRVIGCFPKGPFTASLLSRPLWGGKLFEGEKEEKGSFSRSKRKEKEVFAQIAKEGDLALIAGLLCLDPYVTCHLGGA
jgi:hypothetical protein